MTSRHVITIALSAAGVVSAALIATLLLGDLSVPSTEPAPEPRAAPTSASRAPTPAQAEQAPKPEPAAVEQTPAPPKLEPPGAEPQPPRPARPTIWGDSPPSRAVAPSYGSE